MMNDTETFCSECGGFSIHEDWCPRWDLLKKCDGCSVLNEKENKLCYSCGKWFTRERKGV